MTISKEQARRFLLLHHGLLPPRKLRGKQGVLDYIAHVGCIQFDPVNLVGTNPDLVLQARVAGYRPALLRDLLYQERSLIDGWDKLASIYRTSEWPYFRRHRHRMLNHYGEQVSTTGRLKVAAKVIAAIRTRGPLSSIEIEHDERLHWDWGFQASAVRAAMDVLYAMGKLGIHHRVHNRRAFDLIEKLLPAQLLKVPDPNPKDADYAEWHILRRAGCIGLASLRSGELWLGMSGAKRGSVRPRMSGAERRAAMGRLVKRGEALRVHIAGVDRQELYMRAADLPTLERAAKPARSKPAAAFIAPLDNLMWHRNMLEWLFDFHYRWEVYTPAAKRKYGYYVLPVLYGERFVARLDPLFDKASRAFTIGNWWWEEGVDKHDKGMQQALAECVRAFAKYLGASSVNLGDAVRSNRPLKHIASLV